MKYPTYPHLKASGISWLGDVPQHWAIIPLKRQIDRNDGGVWGEDPDGISDTVVLRSTEQTVDGKWNIEKPAFRKISISEVNASLLIEGDLLLTKSSGSSLHIGKTTLVDSRIEALRCCYSNFMQRIRVKQSLMPKLAWYLMNSDLVRFQLDLLSNSTTGLANLNGTTVGKVSVAIPPLSEQIAIATFLDRETAKIDALVAKKRQLIDALQAKRTAVISQTVTRGLPPQVAREAGLRENPPLKPSGIAWLGEVPEHWHVKKLKFAANIKTGFAFSSDDFKDEGVPVLRIGDITPEGQVDLSEARFLEERFALTHSDVLVRPADIVMAMTGATVGKAGRHSNEAPALMNQRVCLFRPTKEILNPFLWYLLKSDFYAEHVRLTAFGGAQPNISDRQLLLCPVPIPPLREQVSIAAFLDSENAKIDAIASKVEAAIEKLQQYRTALISSAVTGKIDVRSAA